MSDKSKKYFGYDLRLRAERKRLKKTQQEFAALGGVTIQTQQNYESGRRAPASDYLNRLAAAGVNVHYIITNPAEDGPRLVLLQLAEAEFIDKYRGLSEYWCGKMDAYLEAAAEADVSAGTNRRVRERKKEE